MLHHQSLLPWNFLETVPAAFQEDFFRHHDGDDVEPWKSSDFCPTDEWILYGFVLEVPWAPKSFVSSAVSKKGCFWRQWRYK